MINQFDLLKMPWNVLIILDACRYDSFHTVVPSAQAVYNDGCGETVAWVNKFLINKPYKPPTFYVTWNPVCYTIVQNSEKDTGLILKQHPKNSAQGAPFGRADALNDFIKSWLTKNGQPESMVLHYMQPHDPYIGEDLKGYIPHGIHRNDKTVMPKFPSFDDIKARYNHSVRFALKHVFAMIQHLKGKIIITSDHGELFGEYNQKNSNIPIYGHYAEWLYPEITTVPWFELNLGKYEPTVLNEESDYVENKQLQERLKNLGYM